MAWNDRDYARQAVLQKDQVTSFASQVYTWMTTGLATTAAIAYLVYHMGWYASLLNFTLLIVLAQLGLVFAIQAGLRSMSFEKLLTMFYAYSGLNGLMFGAILPLYAMRYGGDIIWVAFASCAAVFAAATVYGRTTQTDLTRFAHLLQFGLYALIALTLTYFVLSFFMNVGGLSLIIAYVGLAVFVGLLIMESQQIRVLSQQVEMGSTESKKLALMSALGMYINVVTIFWYLLRILSANRD